MPIDDKQQRGFPTLPQNYVRLELIASKFRRHGCSTDVAERLDCLWVFERLDEVTVRTVDGEEIELCAAVKALPRGVEGETRFDDDSGKIRVVLAEATYDRLEEDEPRARFSLAHELGHAIVHARKLREMREIPHDVPALRKGEVPRHRYFEDSEWQADAFGAALLMPAAGLAELEAHRITLTPALVARHFGVSPEAARYRLDNYRSRRVELTKAGRERP